MAAILANASPLNPFVLKVNKSSADRILEVAWRSKANSNWSLSIPTPLSMTLINSLPDSLITKVILVDPASTAFSSNSLTTEAGRCTTSPAAI